MLEVSLEDLPFAIIGYGDTEAGWTDFYRKYGLPERVEGAEDWYAHPGERPEDPRAYLAKHATDAVCTVLRRHGGLVPPAWR
jgi:hypothetical protein